MPMARGSMKLLTSMSGVEMKLASLQVMATEPLLDGEKSRKKHEKTTNNSRISITMYRTGNAAGDNGPTAFLPPGKQTQAELVGMTQLMGFLTIWKAGEPFAWTMSKMRYIIFLYRLKERPPQTQSPPLAIGELFLLLELL